EMTTKAIEVLSRDEDGFFLMVEGGQIDWAGHGNDAGLMLHEMIKFDAAVRTVFNWAKGRDDTLVIITADHETGGFGFSYSRSDVPEPTDLPGSAFEGRKYAPNFNFGPLPILDKLYAQKMSFFQIMQTFNAEKRRSAKTLMELVNANSAFPLSPEGAKAVLASEKNTYHIKDHTYLSAKTFPKVDDFEAFYVYGEDIRGDLIGRELATQQNVVWATGTHTHTPVAVITYGPPSATEPFGDLLHHTELGQLAIQALGKP
ncbi:MAG: alkaline phosphatase, partial [Myxococcota bacterium]